MTKLATIAVLFAFATVISAQTPPNECAVNKQAALNLANFADRVYKGQGKHNNLPLKYT